MSKKIEARPRKTSRQAAKTKTETVYCPDENGAFRLEQIAHDDKAGDSADCTLWPDEAEITSARTSEYSSHVDAYWNASFQQELASNPLGSKPPQDPPPPDGQYSPQELADLRDALVLLSGYQDRGAPDRPRLLPAKKYLEPSEELAGRKAIARLLRSGKPVDRTILVRLAALFDPEPETEPFIELSPIGRTLEFKPRKTTKHNGHGNRPVTADISRLELAIAFKAEWERLGGPDVWGAQNQALENISKKYPAGKRTILNAWAFYKSIVPCRS